MLRASQSLNGNKTARSQPQGQSCSDEHSKLIYIEVLKRGDRQTVQKNTRVMFECPATASSFLLTSFCHLMQSDHGVGRFLVTVKKETQSIDKNDFFICICLRPCIRGQSIYFDMFVMNSGSTRIDKVHLSERI